MTPSQVATLLPGFHTEVELAELEAAGWIELETRLMHPELRLVEPVMTWHPDESEPDFYPVAKHLRSRWNKAPIETTVAVATKEARKLCGGYNVKPRATEWRHDVAMSGVYLNYFARGEQRGWISGDELRVERRWHFGDRVPDAVIVRGDEVERIVEMGGSYNRGKLEAMHVEFCVAPYEIW